MAVPTRTEALETLENGHTELMSIFAELSDEAASRPGTIGSTGWSAKDALGHIAFWEELASEFAADWRAGRLPAILTIFSAGKVGMDSANARNQSEPQRQTMTDVRIRAAAAYARITEVLRGIGDDMWLARPNYPTPRADTCFAEIIGAILGGPERPFDHAHEHLADLRIYALSERRGAP